MHLGVLQNNGVMKRTLKSTLIALSACLALLASPAVASAAPTAPSETGATQGIGHGGQRWLCNTFGIFC